VCAGTLGVCWRLRLIAISSKEASAARKGIQTRTRDKQQRDSFTFIPLFIPFTTVQFSALHSTFLLLLLSMGDALVNVHETLQDSLDVVSMANSTNTPSTHLCAAVISAFIYHGAITSTRKFGTSDHPSICKPRRLSNITRFSLTSEYLRVQW
jgi:hypothetical protein